MMILLVFLIRFWTKTFFAETTLQKFYLYSYRKVLTFLNIVKFN